MTVLWGLDLWDQFDNVDKHFQHGIEFTEKYSKFVKERASIEQDYASKLRKLAKGYMPRKRDEERNKFSTHKSFQAQLSELKDIANQHEIVADEMMDNIAKVCANHCQEMKIEKKKLYQEGKNNQSHLDSQERALDQTKKKFKSAWLDCEKALAYYQKLDADNDATKADVEKAKHTWQMKKDGVESCKTDYGASLTQFNRDQNDHYEQNMPKVFQSYAESEAKRICKLRDLMVEYAKIDIKVKPIIQKCLDGMEQAANGIDAEKDLELVVETLKSGFTPPPDKEFEDYTNPSNRKHNDSNESSITPRRPTKGGGLSWIFGKKTVEAPDYSHLPPEQRRKKLQSKIEDIRKDINQEENGKRGMLKMQDVYRANPALGDPNTLEPQIREVTAKIDKLQAVLSQHEAWHADASGTLATQSPRRPSTNNSSRNNSRPSSTIDVQGGAAPVDVNTYEDPEALTSANNFPTPPPLSETEEFGGGKPALHSQQSFVDDFEDETEPVGTCVALYDFDATSEGALSMKAGEKFTILEADNGDGWTRAMNESGDGYIPTSYVDPTFFA